ncbi:MAG: hypothetical protein AAGI15_04525 [Pseudomonadota bacterium]
MKAATQSYATVSAISPTRNANEMIDSVLKRDGASALVWKARGTLVRDHWRSRWLPAVSPARTMVQMLVPESSANAVVTDLVQAGRLDLQATGAVFSTPCQQLLTGSRFRLWPDQSSGPQQAPDAVKDSLQIIFCIVAHAAGERVSKAAMDAGAHGPIVYYCEGRGLRDRLGWLRITKENEKEVLLVMADTADVDEVFSAMAKAGQLHLPGRGFMYRMPVTAGLYNLPSRVSHHHYEANMQQVINAIDHLAGHTHWRDQGSVDLGEGRGAGIDMLARYGAVLEDQRAVTAYVSRDDSAAVMELLLDGGAPGLNVHHARFVGKQQDAERMGALVNHEYTVLRCITEATVAEGLLDTLQTSCSERGVEDLCVVSQEVPKVATYVPGTRNFRGRAA